MRRGILRHQAPSGGATTTKRVRLAGLAVVLLLSLAAPAALAQTNVDPEAGAPVRDTRRIELARSSMQYPVTPGDVYRLTYEENGSSREAPVVVDPTGRVNLGRFGSVDSRGLTFPELEERVKALVGGEIQDAFPRFRIESVARFYVTLQGEVPETLRAEAWGLTRLSEVLEGRLTDYGSRRRVTLRGADGSEGEYDIFAAERWGQKEEDPLLRPGDEITVHRYRRQVSLQGPVRRPGTYQMLPGEELPDLVERYGGGLLDGADRSRVRIQTCPEPEDCTTRVRFVSLDNDDPGVLSLTNGDRVTVQSRQEYLPFVYIEGAVGAARRESRFEMTTDRIRYRLRPGDRLSSLMRELSDQFIPESDLRGVYIERRGTNEQIPVNVEALLYSGDVPQEDMILMADDRIVIPFRQFFVTVSGAVDDPGQFAYIPNRDFRYYLGLAGGIDPARRIGTDPRIRDVEGHKKPDDAIINPEDTIHFRSNNPAYYMQFITPVLTVITMGLTTWAVVAAMQ